MRIDESFLWYYGHQFQGLQIYKLVTVILNNFQSFNQNKFTTISLIIASRSERNWCDVAADTISFILIVKSIRRNQLTRWTHLLLEMAYVDWRGQGGLIKAASEREYIYSEIEAMNGWLWPKSGMKDNHRESSLSEGKDKGKEGNKKAQANDSYQTKLIMTSNCIKILIGWAWLTWLPINVAALVDFVSARNKIFYVPIKTFF